MFRVFLLSVLAAGHAFAAVDFIVGRDALSSLEAARDAIRTCRRNGDSTHKTVLIRAGEHFREQTFVLLPEDSNVTYRGECGAKIIGAREISDWRLRADGKWEATLPIRRDGSTDWFDTLWADGERLVRVRAPNVGYFHPTSLRTSFQTNATGRAAIVTDCQRLTLPEDMAKMLDRSSKDEIARAVVVTHHNWNAERNLIVDYESVSNVLTVTGVRHAPWNPWRTSSLYFFENLPAALDAPGEWIFKPDSGKVLYVPRPGDVLGKTRFWYAVPGLRHLVELKGDVEHEKFVQRIAFENLFFGYTSASTEELPIRGVQGAAWSLAAVMADAAQECRFERCTFAHTAEYAVWFRSGCRNDRVLTCELYDLGAGGVRIGVAKEGRFTKPGAGKRISEKDLKPFDTAFITVEDCLLANGGRRLPEGIGVFIGHGAFNRIIHNEIRDFNYSAISVGYVWGYSGSVSQGNEIGWNRIRRIGGVLADLGGVYLLGTAFGTRVHHNFISDIDSYAYGGWGIYTDEGSEGVRIDDNIVVRTKSGSFHQHYGRNNIISNNVFAQSKEGVFAITRVETNHCSFVVEGNVLLASPSGVIMRDVKAGRTGSVWRRNLYYAAKGGERTFGGKDFSDWEKFVNESDGRFSDPMFCDPVSDNWKVAPESPVWGLGIRIPDLSDCGRHKILFQ